MVRFAIVLKLLEVMDSDLNTVFKGRTSVLGDLIGILNAGNRRLLELHHVACQSTCFVREDVFNLT